MGTRRRGVFHDEPLLGAAALHAAHRCPRHLPPRIRGGLRGRRAVPADDAPACDRLPLADLDHRGIDPPRPVAPRRVVRHPRRRRALGQGERGLISSLTPGKCRAAASIPAEWPVSSIFGYRNRIRAVSRSSSSLPISALSLLPQRYILTATFSWPTSCISRACGLERWGWRAYIVSPC